MKRQRITITLREDLLKKIDETTGMSGIRNRSHAIEFLLDKILQSRVKKALIATGGRRDEAKSLKREESSTLLTFEGKLLLEHQIELLKNFGIRDVVILVDAHEGEIKQHFGDGNRFGVNLTYGEQKEKEIGTGHILYLVRNFFSKDPFLMLYGDIFAQIDLEDFVNHHINSGVVATAALTSIKDPSPYGVASLKGDKVVEFIEKPREKEDLPRVISSGIFCFEPAIFEYLSSKKNVSLEKEIFPKLAKEGKLGGYLFEGKWCNVWNRVCYEGVKTKPQR
ncbi:hypothetical protein IID24_00645 [Patescibacteria group bacterium]|nr:hypothetical protein [Patescibacteria group bacterium]